jgi:hypothetical protein
MGRTRRLVTTLSRLLATKSDVVARVQKRLLTQVQGELATAPTAMAITGSHAGEIGAIPLVGTRGANQSDGQPVLDTTGRREAAEVAIYYGDVQGVWELDHCDSLKIG